MNEWQTLTLADVCTVITDGAHQSPKTVSRGKPMASVKDLTRFGVDLTSARHIATEDFEALVKQGCKPHVGDVLIAKDGNSALDTVCTVDHPLDAVLLSSVAILRPDPKCLDSVFLKFYLSSPETIDYLKSNFISGAAIPRVVCGTSSGQRSDFPVWMFKDALLGFFSQSTARLTSIAASTKPSKPWRKPSSNRGLSISIRSKPRSPPSRTAATRCALR